MHEQRGRVILNLKRYVNEEERKVHTERFRVATYFMAVPLVLSFSVIDYIYRPDLWLEFLYVRLLIVPVSLLMWVLFKTKYGKTTVPSLIFTGFLGLYSAYLTWRTGGASSPYYAGLNLVTIGSLSFLPWPTKRIPLVALIIYGPHLATMFFETNIDWRALAPNLAFMGSTIFLSLITHELTARLRWREVELRLRLQNEIETKDQVIEDKTRHGIFLEKLALQFSPQVVDAIKGGMLQLEERSRRPITCIFIDIESSTERSTRLDYVEYSEIISLFFSEVIEVLLNHDITVGTYLGDGLMAFTNAPLDQPDHQQRALSACLDVLKLHDRKRRYYTERWRAPFNIRIGINSGNALVGFFPNAKRGTFTAIGDVVNLASRLCGLAPANSICATKEYLRTVNGRLQNLKVEANGRTDTIKGFHGETFELFTLTNITSEIESPDKSTCPLCSSQLFVAEKLGGVDVVRCTGCAYHDFVDAAVPARAA